MTGASQLEEMKRYLFYEMSQEESGALEERFFEDSDYFYELIELENDLTDSYAAGNLSGDDLKRFERSIAKSPERREKIANARALQTLIAEEKPTASLLPAPTLWERMSGFFNLKNPALQYAAGALIILVVCATGLLLYRSWQNNQEFVENEKRREAEIIEKEKRRKELEEEQRRVEEERRQNQTNRDPNANVNFQTTNNNSSSGDEERKNEIEKLKREVEDLRRRNIQPKNSSETAPPEPLLAYVRPTGRGAKVDPVAEQVVTRGEPIFKIVVQLPVGKKYDSYEIKTSGGKIISGSIPQGGNSFAFNLPLSDPDFEIKVTERGAPESLGAYRLELRKNR